ncbi:uncharacterized protein LOC135491980 isoform X2 [Lineus longissimus]|uniref:uncharacterized protein LOC135491980 isoform X2 n=1 Tax=Lineus longissimus TaxID=88925 RepID=UPI00315D9ADA
MADFASRRAARRKRILENSDDRMKKLLGTYGHTEQPDADPPPWKEPAKENTPSSDTPSNDAAPSNDASAFSLLPESDQAAATNGNHDGSGETNSSGLRLRINQNSDLTETRQTENKHYHRVENSETTAPETEQQILRTGKYSSRPTDVDKTDEAAEIAHQIGILRLRVILFFIAAVIVRLVLVSGLGVLYTQSTVLPFILVEASFLMYLSSSPEGILNSCGQPGGSLLTSALMLSGIRPQVITSYTNISTTFSMCFEDFAVYFFSFVMTHWLIRCFE